MNITVTGNLGSGKSTVCKELGNLGYEVISTGGIFRQIAAEEGLNVVQLNERVREEAARGIHDVDDRIDRLTQRLGREKDHMVFDSRLAWHFVENSFKVFLTVDIGVAAGRVQQADRETERFDSLEECRENLLKRQFVEQGRFRELYGIDYYNMHNYNLVLETTAAAPGRIVEEILRQLAEFEAGAFTHRVLINPSSLYPTKDVRESLADDIFRPRDKEQEGVGMLRCGIRNNSFYALEGHEEILEAIRGGQPFVSVEVHPEIEIAKSGEEIIAAFEEKGGFRYASYPVRGEENQNLLNFAD